MLMKRLKLLAAVLAVASMMVSTTRLYAQSASEVKEEVDAYKDEVSSGIGTLSSRIADLEAAGKLKFKGDVRFRDEYFTQSQDDSPTLKTTPNTAIPNRSRYRIRLRFGAEKQFGDDVFAAFRLVTGAQTDPTSTNQTLGNEEYFKTILVDQAFLKYSPTFLDKRLDVYAGKMANILDSTAITWDGDVTPEGVAGALKLPMLFTLKGQWMILAENSSARDQYLYNAQLAKDLKVADQDIHLMVGYEFVPWVSSMLVHRPVGLQRRGPGARWSLLCGYQRHGGQSFQGRPHPRHQDGRGDVGHEEQDRGVPFKWTLHAARNTNSFSLNMSTGPAVSTSVSVTTTSPCDHRRGAGDEHGSGFDQQPHHRDHGARDDDRARQSTTDDDDHGQAPDRRWFARQCRRVLREDRHRERRRSKGDLFRGPAVGLYRAQRGVEPLLGFRLGSGLQQPEMDQGRPGLHAVGRPFGEPGPVCRQTGQLRHPGQLGEQHDGKVQPQADVPHPVGFRGEDLNLGLPPFREGGRLDTGNPAGLEQGRRNPGITGPPKRRTLKENEMKKFSKIMVAALSLMVGFAATVRSATLNGAGRPFRTPSIRSGSTSTTRRRE
jgi:hypothetical protein